MNNTDKKIALVTGASRGIGKATALKLAQQNIHVIALARTIGGLEELDDEINAAGGSCTLIPQDLSKTDKLQSLGPLIADKFGRLDFFIANAGMLGTLGPVTHAKPKEFETVLKVNVTANFHLLRTLDPVLKLATSPKVMFLTTGADVMEGRAYWGAYGISKAALQTLAVTYAAENEKTNIEVIVHDPKRVRTAMRAAAKPGEDPMTLPTPGAAAQEILDLLKV